MNFYILNKDDVIVSTLSTETTSQEAAPLFKAELTEVLNGVHQLEIITVSDSELTAEIKEDYSILFKDEQGYKEFLIDEVVDSDSNYISEKTVTASFSPVELKDDLLFSNYGFTNARQLLQSMLNGTRWQVGTVESGISNRNFNEETENQSVWTGVNAVAKVFECDLYFHVTVSEKKVVQRYVSLYKQIGSNSGKRFEIDKDITEIKRTVDTTEIKTAIYPVGKETEDDIGHKSRIDISSVEWKKSAGDPTDKPKGQMFISDNTSRIQWGRKNSDGTIRDRFIFMEMDFDSPEALASMAWVQLGRYSKPKVTYEAKVIDLYRLTADQELKHEQVFIGDTVSVIDRNFSNPIEISERVIELKKDLLLPENTSVVIGSAKGSYSSDINRVDVLESKVDEVNSSIINVITSANGKNKTYHQSTEPNHSILAIGDSWVRPHPDNPTETQWLVWNGTNWDIILDTSETSEIKAEIEELEEISKDAQEKADQAIEDAGFSKIEVGKIKEEVTEISEITIATSEKSDKALAEAEASRQTANEASQKAFNSEQLANSAKQDALSALALGDGNRTQIESIEGQQKITNSKVEGNTVKINSLQNDADGMKVSIGKVQKDVDSTQTELATLEASYKGFQKTVTSDITGLQSQQTQTSEQLSSTVQQVNNLYEPKANMIKDSMNIMLNKSDTGISGNHSFSEGYFSFMSGKGGRDVYNDTDIFTTEPRPKSEKFTLSMDVNSFSNSFNIYIKSSDTWEGPFNVKGASGRRRIYIEYTQQDRTAHSSLPLGIKIANISAFSRFEYGKFKLIKGHTQDLYDVAFDDVVQKTEVTQLANQIALTALEVKTLDTTVTKQQGQIVILTDQISQTVIKIETVDDKVVKQQTQIIQLDSRITQVVREQTELNTKYSKIEQTTDAIRSEVVEIGQAVSDIGTYVNYLINADSFSNSLPYTLGMASVYKSGVDESEMVKGVFKVVQRYNNNGRYHIVDDKSYLERGVEYTLSGNFEKYNLDINVELVLNNSATPSKTLVLNSSKDWEFTFTVPKTGNYDVRFYTMGSSRNYSYLSKMKLNKGNKRIAQTVDTASLSFRISTVEQTSNGLKTEVAVIKNEQVIQSSQITQLSDNINLRVEKDKVISQINISPETIRIQSKFIHLSGTSLIDYAVIKTAHIADLAVTGAKIQDASISNAKIINLDVDKISGNTTNFVQSNWNGLNSQVQITSEGLVAYDLKRNENTKLSSKGIEFFGDGKKTGQLSSSVIGGNGYTGIAVNNSSVFYLGYNLGTSGSSRRVLEINSPENILTVGGYSGVNVAGAMKVKLKEVISIESPGGYNDTDILDIYGYKGISAKTNNDIKLTALNNIYLTFGGSSTNRIVIEGNKNNGYLIFEDNVDGFFISFLDSSNITKSRLKFKRTGDIEAIRGSGVSGKTLN